MEAKENTEMTAKTVSKAMAEKATSQMKRSKRVYGDYTPEKGVMTSKIVMDALENLKQATVANAGVLAFLCSTPFCSHSRRVGYRIGHRPEDALQVA